MARLIGKIPVRNELGEGIFWNVADQAFWWTDIEGKKVYRFHMESNKLEDFDTPMRLASFAPRQNEQSFVAAFENGFAMYDPRSGALDWINQPDLPANVRFNDGRIDRQGRFWCGTMVEDGNGDAGELYCLEPSHSLRTVTNGIGISNGIGFSPTGDTMYFADSTKQRVWAFDYDGATGEPRTSGTSSQPTGSLARMARRLMQTEITGRRTGVVGASTGMHQMVSFSWKSQFRHQTYHASLLADRIST